MFKTSLEFHTYLEAVSLLLIGGAGDQSSLVLDDCPDFRKCSLLECSNHHSCLQLLKLSMIKIERGRHVSELLVRLRV